MESETDMLNILNSYRQMALDPAKHKVIVKDKSLVQFLAYSLDSEVGQVIETALQTLDLLIQNRHNVDTLRTTFGIMEAILATSQRDDIDVAHKNTASRLYRVLESSAYSKPTSPTTTPTMKRKVVSKMLTFHVFGLNEERREMLIEILVSKKGVISVVVDVPHQRCIVRAIESVSPQLLAEAVSKETDMYASLVVKNNMDQEVLLNVTSQGCGDTYSIESEDSNELPSYLPEDESPVKEKAMISLDRFRSNASSWVRSASTFLQEAFYW